MKYKININSYLFQRLQMSSRDSIEHLPDVKVRCVNQKITTVLTALREKCLLGHTLYDKSFLGQLE